MSVVNLTAIETALDNFVIKVVNVLCSTKVYSYEFAKRAIINELMRDSSHFTDYHLNLESNIGNLINVIDDEDMTDFVSYLLCITHLNESTITLDEIRDASKIASITTFAGEFYDILYDNLA